MNGWVRLAEGCFFIKYKSETKLGTSVKLIIQVAQHTRDEELLNSFIEYLGCGFIVKRKNKEACEYKVENFPDILNKIIPFFDKNQIKGVKFNYYLDWCKVAEIIKSKNHLTLDGYN
uniref:Homing endonuclease LAGLIDADG domain-containing protein n=1 Tax=Orbilia brochopaga TaxID=3140254 RepID=A0A4Y5MV48_9PEZI|nr:hypothetical protein [Drechslerella brochopaga]